MTSAVSHGVCRCVMPPPPPPTSSPTRCCEVKCHVASARVSSVSFDTICISVIVGVPGVIGSQSSPGFIQKGPVALKLRTYIPIGSRKKSIDFKGSPSFCALPLISGLVFQKKPVGKLALFFPQKSSNKWSGSTDLPLQQTQRRCGEWRAKTPHQWTRRDGLIHSVCYPELALTVAGLTALWAQPGAGETFQCKIVLILQNNPGNTSRTYGL
ncbi:hypothetical protein J6590_054395 [Homalodisca vitripennis]|nr:hypothetical protein J6590_054395 [Homalodisca vitripennis]